MKFTAFQSEQGDSILISSDNNNILVDGGMRTSYEAHVAPTLEELAKSDQKLDLVCVSHIDQDHILGILSMLNDEMNWRVFEYQKSNGNNRVKKPKSIRPPIIDQVWHNAFHEQINENTGKIEDMLAAFSVIFADKDIRKKLGSTNDVANYASSIRQAILLSRRIQAKQLNIPLNPQFDGKLVTSSKKNKEINIGNFKITIIGPSSQDLHKLRKDWNNWLQKNNNTIRNIQRTAHKDEQKIGNDSIPWLGTIMNLASKLGDRNKVTLPNLASIMFLVEINGKSILMTGDGHWDDILKGLKSEKKLAFNGSIHVDILKVQHHGSEHNLNETFCKKLTADHYVFCGDGSHHNPDLNVVKAIINSRISTGDARAITEEVGNEYTLWFNSSEDVTKARNRSHMAKLEEMVKELASQHDTLKFQFMPTNKSKLEIIL